MLPSTVNNTVEADRSYQHCSAVFRITITTTQAARRKAERAGAEDTLAKKKLEEQLKQDDIRAKVCACSGGTVQYRVVVILGLA